MLLLLLALAVLFAEPAARLLARALSLRPEPSGATAILPPAKAEPSRPGAPLRSTRASEA
jgi:hypothetical protein